ncbi:hypothetical protein HY988_05465 [Candidatus Micrarchaeota archaeon]|nr:hypothetical protein [Candidatus Micrarchaeota archaeon]
MDSPTYSELNREWKTTCRIVLGSEIGELQDYKDWLIELNNPRFVKKCSKSKVETVFTSNNFPNEGKFITMEEVDFNKKFEPLGINEMKDIDSILEALDERLYYCGNIILGNSKFVEKSSNIQNSFFVYDSVKISDSKNIAYSQYLRLCENIFGTNEGGESKFCIRCSILFRNMRSFELWKSTNCSDCYYSFGLDNCSESFFSFNLIGKRHVIGNLILTKDKYAQIKKKLLSEVVGKLKKDKRLDTLVELTSKSEPNNSIVQTLVEKINQQNEIQDKKPIEISFVKTSSLLFEKPLEGGIDSYSNWLRTHTVVPYQLQSVISKQSVQMSQWPGLAQLPKSRLVTYDEGLKIGEHLAIGENEVQRVNMDNSAQIIGKIAYYSPEQITGNNSNLIECQWGAGATNCYRTVICAYSKNCAYCSWPRSSDHCFGCGIAFDCGFCLKCFDSVKLERCFEVDGGRDSSDSYFCHNIEGMRQAMFCFNTKNKHYAIGNAEVGRETFGKVKEMVQDWAFGELDKKKRLDLSIYNLTK